MQFHTQNYKGAKPLRGRNPLLFPTMKRATAKATSNNSLQRWNDTLNHGKRAQLNRPDTNIPLSPARLDMAAYTFSYHMNGGCALEKVSFWGNSHVREMLLKYRFEQILKIVIVSWKR